MPLAGPLYKEVKRQLMDALTRGEWKPGEAIPAERRLSERFGISIGTVRKAIDELVAENILIRQQGRGTYVASHNRDRMLFYFFHVVTEAGPKAYPDVELLSFARGQGRPRRRGAPRASRAGDAVFRIRNRLSLAGAPIIIDDITLPVARFPGLTERQFRERTSTIYNLYQEAFGISVVQDERAAARDARRRRDRRAARHAARRAAAADPPRRVHLQRRSGRVSRLARQHRASRVLGRHRSGMSSQISLTCADILAGRAPADTPVTVKGWVRTRRDSKAGISFVHVSDGSGFHPVQVVAPNTLPNYADEVQQLTAGCAVEATGTIVPSPAKGQPFEMQATAVKVVGWVDDPDTYPIQPKPHTLEFLREVAHLRPRTNVIGAVTRVRHTIAQAIHRFFDERRLLLGQHADHHRVRCRGRGRAVPRVDARSREPAAHAATARSTSRRTSSAREAFLTVSGQLNVETYCLALSKVYTFGPTFRAENSNTSRHLAEFWMIEPEIAFADLADDATLAEALLKHIFSDGARRARRRHGVLRGAHREGRDRQAAGHRRQPSSCAWTTPRRSASSSARSRSSSSR